MIRLLLFVIGYGIGLIQMGYLYGRMKGIDIRKEGSGNSGATNSLRVLGKKAGLIVFLGDLLKALIPCLAVKLIFREKDPDYAYVYMLYMALGVITGHNFPFYLQFKGGKGISSTAGYILAYDLRISGICLIAFVAVVSLTKYVSLGSLLVVTINYVMSLIFLGLHWIPVSGKAVPEFIVLITVITALAWIKHRANISRLLKGTENKLSFHGKTDH